MRIYSRSILNYCCHRNRRSKYASSGLKRPSPKIFAFQNQINESCVSRSYIKSITSKFASKTSVVNIPVSSESSNSPGSIGCVDAAVNQDGGKGRGVIDPFVHLSSQWGQGLPPPEPPLSPTNWRGHNQ